MFPTCGVRQHSPAASAPAVAPPAPQTAPTSYPASQTRRGKNKWVAFVLALLLGGIGVHKFYLGKYAQGIIYLILFWTFIPGIVAFIESLVYLYTPPETFRERYSID